MLKPWKFSFYVYTPVVFINWIILTTIELHVPRYVGDSGNTRVRLGRGVCAILVAMEGLPTITNVSTCSPLVKEDFAINMYCNNLLQTSPEEINCWL